MPRRDLMISSAVSFIVAARRISQTSYGRGAAVTYLIPKIFTTTRRSATATTAPIYCILTISRTQQPILDWVHELVVVLELVFWGGAAAESRAITDTFT